MMKRVYSLGFLLNINRYLNIDENFFETVFDEGIDGGNQ